MGRVSLVVLKQCVAYNKNKMTYKKIRKSPMLKATQAFECIFSDLCGPMEVLSLGGS